MSIDIDSKTRETWPNIHRWCKMARSIVLSFDLLVFDLLSYNHTKRIQYSFCWQFEQHFVKLHPTFKPFHNRMLKFRFTCVAPSTNATGGGQQITQRCICLPKPIAYITVNWFHLLDPNSSAKCCPLGPTRPKGLRNSLHTTTQTDRQRISVSLLRKGVATKNP